MPCWSWCLRGKSAERGPIDPVPALESSNPGKDARRGEPGRFPFDVSLGDVAVAGADHHHERGVPESAPEPIEREVGRHAAGPEHQPARLEPAEPEPPTRRGGPLREAVDLDSRVPRGPAHHAVREQLEVAEIDLALDIANLLRH